MRKLRIGSVVRIEGATGLVMKKYEHGDGRMLVLWAIEPRRHTFKFPREKWFMTDTKWVACTVVVW